MTEKLAIDGGTPVRTKRLPLGRGLAVFGDEERNAVDEVLRYESPVQITLRTAYDDTVVEGVEVPRGQSVVVLIAGANRDPAVFDAPNLFDVTRKNASVSVTTRGEPFVNAFHWRGCCLQLSRCTGKPST